MKRIIALLLVLALGVCFCACGEASDSSDVASVESNTSDTASDDASKDTVSVDLPDATLTVKLKKGDLKTFKSDRPYDESKEDISIILVVGQSNFTTTVGYVSEYKGVVKGKIDSVSSEPVLPEAGTCYSGSSGKAVTVLGENNDMHKLCDTSRLDKTISGVTPSFGIKWHELTGTKVVFVQTAVGSTGVHEWTPNPKDYVCECNGGSQLYSRAVNLYKNSYATLSKSYNVVYTGYIWNQGEHEEVYGKPECQSTVNSDQAYYDAYKSMHDGLMAELGLDFGGISVVRADKAGKNAKGSMNLTVARNAQYKLCHDIDNLFMVSTMGETCDPSAPLDMDKTNTIHYSQATFNKMGAECADNLYKCLGLATEKAEFSGLTVYSTVADKLAEFDKDGKAIGEAVVARSLVTNHLLAKLNTLGTGYTVSGFELTAADGTDLSDCIDGFGAIDWISAMNGHTISDVEFKCVIE